LKSLRDIVTGPDIYVDGNQDYARALKGVKGFTVCQLSCDLAWINKNSKLVGVEEKKAPDFSSSMNGKRSRLPRQLRELIDEVDVPVLALRLDGFSNVYWSWDEHGNDMESMLRLIEWAPRGLLIMLPSLISDMEIFLPLMRSAMEKENVRILAGSDRKRPKSSSPFQRALMRLFNGCGKKTAARIEDYFKSGKYVAYSFQQALAAPNEAWKNAGANKLIIKQLEELR